MSQIRSFLGLKMASYVKILGKWAKIFSLKNIKNYFREVYMDEFDPATPIFVDIFQNFRLKYSVFGGGCKKVAKL